MAQYVQGSISKALVIFAATTAIVLWASYKSLSGLALAELNSHRLGLIIREYVGGGGAVPDPAAVNRAEMRVLPLFAGLRSRDPFRVDISAPLERTAGTAQGFEELRELYAGGGYLLNVRQTAAQVSGVDVRPPHVPPYVPLVSVGRVSAARRPSCRRD